MDDIIPITKRIDTASTFFEINTGKQGFIGYLEMKYLGKTTEISFEVESGIEENIQLPYVIYQIIALVLAVGAAQSGIMNGFTEQLRANLQARRTKSALKATYDYGKHYLYSFSKRQTNPYGLPDYTNNPFVDDNHSTVVETIGDTGAYSITKMAAIDDLQNVNIVLWLDEKWPDSLLEKARIFINDLRICSLEYVQNGMCPVPAPDNDSIILRGSWCRQDDTIVWHPTNGVLKRGYAMTASLSFDINSDVVAGSDIWIQGRNSSGAKTSDGIRYTTSPTKPRVERPTILVVPGQKIEYAMSIPAFPKEYHNVQIALDIDLRWPDAIGKRAEVLEIKNLRWCSVAHSVNGVCPEPDITNDAEYLPNSVNQNKTNVVWSPPNGTLPPGKILTAEIIFAPKESEHAKIIIVRGEMQIANFLSRCVGINYVIQDDEIDNAIEQARKHLDILIEDSSSSPSQLDISLIKLKPPSNKIDSIYEHVWADEVTYDGVTFTGKIGEDTVSVSISDISDWMIVRGNKVIGGYTMRLLRRRMNQKEREKFNKKSGFIFKD